MLPFLGHTMARKCLRYGRIFLRQSVAAVTTRVLRQKWIHRTSLAKLLRPVARAEHHLQQGRAMLSHRLRRRRAVGSRTVLSNSSQLPPMRSSAASLSAHMHLELLALALVALAALAEQAEQAAAQAARQPFAQQRKQPPLQLYWLPRWRWSQRALLLLRLRLRAQLRLQHALLRLRYELAAHSLPGVLLPPLLRLQDLPLELLALLAPQLALQAPTAAVELAALEEAQGWVGELEGSVAWLGGTPRLRQACALKLAVRGRVLHALQPLASWVEQLATACRRTGCVG